MKMYTHHLSLIVKIIDNNLYIYVTHILWVAGRYYLVQLIGP